MENILDSLRDFFKSIREINERYKHPRIQTTRMVSLALLMLRVYLIAMLALLLYKFISVVVH